jgi:hypothetical protein
MLNYLGPNIGPRGPIATQLPGATPGTMPGAIPRVPNAETALPNLPHTPPRSAAPAPAARGPVHPAHSAIAKAILNHPLVKGLHALANQPPPPPDYSTTTQADGSILLHLKNADGTLGPVVKVIPPIKKAAGPAGPAGAAPQ